ncbi:cytochrome b/b6 domain-containing protein [Halorhodospira neutriphila]|uniref:Hydrogenase n=1 Tax=Halorhodospira neutriphila TaxID=168379 RepID=A0ABS1E679_9GAMM|nr:cytochrome b/b6 domain-containing protein [Halorhodospira neutriphila]MBK1725891.1 hydrogenase [Halorhodospira neutriphila]
MGVSGTNAVYVWDLWVRLFHWGLAAAMALAWYSAEQGIAWQQVHAWSGYAVIVLLAFRLLWGLFGSETARFSQFLTGPRRVLNYLRHWRHGASHSIGHNPIGGWAVVVLLAVPFVQAASGLFATDEILFSGPLNPWVSSSTADALTSLHVQLFDLVLALVIVHVAAIGAYRLFRGDRLVKPMITGYKDSVSYQPRIAPAHRALALLAGVIAVFAALLAAASA